MFKLTSLFLLALAAWCAPGLQAQVPGAYPHLVLTDDHGLSVPGPGGPFDNSGVFPAFSGLSFKAQITYQSAGQPNSNVLWCLLVSVAKTPLPTNITPPPLLTMPPFLLVLPTPPNLTGGGFGELPLFVPAGVYAAQTYVQGIVFDVTSAPAMRLSNGLAVTVQVPQFSVNTAFVRSKPAGGDGQLHDVGVIDINAATLKTLKPIGTMAPPVATPSPAPLPDDFRFLPVLANCADEPINPLARPMTRILSAAAPFDTTINVVDTSAFPTRGKLMIQVNTENPWGAKVDFVIPPQIEVVTYDGTTPTSFLNCQRMQLGTRDFSPAVSGINHTSGQLVLGYFTMATTSAAKLRTRVSLDADNRDMPHVVIPAFTFNAGGDLGNVTQDLDLYLYERVTDKVQGFMVLDRGTGTWRPIPGTEKNVLQGRWDPMVAVAPDGRSMIADLQISGGSFGWDNLADGVVAIRLDGLNWPATGQQTWMIPYQTEPDPINSLVLTVRSRRIWMPATAIVGTDPDNYVAYIGLAHKWKFSPDMPGAQSVLSFGEEADYAREEILVRDLIDCPLTPPGSSKALPAMPRPYLISTLGNNGQGQPFIRFDPHVVPIVNHTQLVLTVGAAGDQGGPDEDNEDLCILRNISVSQSGSVNHVLANISGYLKAQGSGPYTTIPDLVAGGQGMGRKLAISPDNQRIAWILRDPKDPNPSFKRDWLQVGFVNGASYAHTKHIYAGTDDTFKINGPLDTDRIIEGLRFIDNTRLVFMMGRNPYTDPININPNGTNAPAMDLFLYDITADTMTNLTKTGEPAGTGFATLGTINPAGYFASPNGEFVYVIRAGGLGPLPPGPAVTNIFGFNVNTLDLFPVTGTEIDASAQVGNLTVGATELTAPIECTSAMNWTEGSGVQDGLIYFSANRLGGNGAKDIFALDRNAPFVVFAATAATKPGVTVSNIAPDPYSAKIAFARTATSDPYGATQHPFVVDLDNFLFERDLVPNYQFGGQPIGRLMDGSFHFIPPAGSAGDALVFSFGLQTLNGGIAGIATPAYYPLSAVSDLLAEPIPVIIPLVDTFLLGTDYRFYLPTAGPSKN